jgi:hypothetical protein
VVLHSLPAGARFDLAARTLLPGAGGRPDQLKQKGQQPDVPLDRLIAVEGALGDVPARRSRKSS